MEQASSKDQSRNSASSILPSAIVDSLSARSSFLHCFRSARFSPKNLDIKISLSGCSRAHSAIAVLWNSNSSGGFGIRIKSAI